MEYLELSEAFFGEDWTFVEADEQPPKDYSMESVSGLLQLAEANRNPVETPERAEKVQALADLARGRRQQSRTADDALTALMRKVR